MPALLGTFDMVALFVMAVFWISNVTGIATGGAASLTYWLIGTVAFFVPCVLVVAQLGILFPYEGSLYNWTYKALGRFWSFFVGLCAWLPGVLSLVSAADVIVNCLQTLNPAWLPLAWQQGVVIIGITLFAGILSVQRTRTVQNIINVTVLFIGLAVLLITCAASIWLLTGHASTTNFGNASGWAISWNPQTGNLSLLGTVTLALLGATMPLNMGGEIVHRKIIVRHLLWGSLLVLVGYLLSTVAVLVVEGQSAALTAPNPIVLLVGIVETVFGKGMGNLTMICLMLFFLVVAVFENVVSARLLMVASIDQRLPTRLARLNRHRVPVNALAFQTVLAVLYTAVVFFVVPLFTFLGNTANLTTEVYTVTAASLLLVWAFSFIFPFVDLVVLAFRFPQAFQAHRLVSLPVLLACCAIGPVICAATIVETLIASWLPMMIPNSQWWYLVGGLTLMCLVLCAIGSMFASSEATWEGWQKA
jgi:amino acid transporter